MKKFAILLGVLICVSVTHAQPPDGPGMGKVERQNADPQMLGEALSEQQKQEARRLATRDEFNKFNHPAGKLDLSSPEATVRSCLWAMFNADFKTARECVENAQPYEKLADIEAKVRADMEQGRDGAGNLLLTDLHTYENGETAIVTLRAVVLIHLVDRDSLLSSSERFVLKRRKIEDGNDSVWKIETSQQPYTQHEGKPETAGVDLLSKYISLLSAPGLAQAEAHLRECQNQIKQIGLGFLQYTQDFNEKFPLLENWQNDITPYIRDVQLFVCPAEKQSEKSYSYNPELNGATLAAVAAPSQTILIYEGKDKKFDFRHELNRVKLTNILFADGHVQSFTKETLDAAMKNQMLQWKLAQ